MEKIIILRSAVLGDFLISSPAIGFVREKYPDAEIYLFTIQSAHKKDRDAVKVYETKKALPWIDFLDDGIVNETIKLMDLNAKYIFRELRKKVKSIKPTKCYILTDPLVKWRGNFSKFLLLKTLGAKCPIYGWHDYAKNKNEKSAADEKNRCINHTLSCLESVLEDKTIKDEQIVVKFPIVISEEGRIEAATIWKDLNLLNKKVYVISPGGIKDHKIWPVENYIDIVRYLLCDSKAEIILTGTNKDVLIGQEIVKECGSSRVHDLIGKTSLMTLAGIFQKAYMLIGNDGGSMHLGDAVGCTVVAIMPGLELSGTVEPWHNINNSLRSKVECSPCYNFDECPNKTYACMKNIKVSDVINVIENAVRNKKALNSVRVVVDRSRKVPLLTLQEDENE